MNIKAIRDERDYLASRSKFELILCSMPSTGSSELEQLEVLGVLLEDYEKKQHAVAAPDPIEAIRFRMEQADLQPRDLVPYLGSRAKVSEVLSGKRPLTLAMIRALHQGLDIPAEALLKETTPTKKDVEVEWEKFPLQEMAARGYFRGLDSYSPRLKGEELLSRAESLMREFVAPLGLENPFGLSALYKKTLIQVRSGRQMDKHSLAAWTLQLVRIAGQPVTAYKPNAMPPDFLKQVGQLSYFEDGPLRVCDLLAHYGISLVIQPHLPRTHLDGAAIVFRADHPIIGLTLRYDRIDNFWFCLLHELWHLRHHFDGNQIEFYDDLDAGTDDNKEKEADEGAGEVLVPQAAWQRSPARLAPSQIAAQRLADELHVHPAIIAGKIRHHNKSFRLLNNLVGQGQVRRLFTDVTWP